MSSSTDAPTAKTGIFKRFRTWLLGTKSTVASWFKTAPKAPDTNPGNDNAKEPMNRLHETILEEARHYSRSLQLPEVEQDFFFALKYMADAGFTDGVYGFKTAREKEVRAIAKSKVARLVGLANDLVKGKLAASATRVQEKKELMERAKEEDSRQHNDLNVLQYYRVNQPERFSRPWSLACILTGIILVVGDFPLSKNLLSIGFDFVNPWESFLTAMGISGCSIFIKIYYDNHVNLKYGGGSVMRLKYDELFNSISKGTPIGVDNYKKIDRTDRVRKNIWHSGILVLTISGIVLLGFFRVEAVKLTNSELVGPKGMPPIIYLLSFIFLTLMFPLISGICFSIGFTGFQNSARFRKAEKDCAKSTANFIHELQEFTNAQKENADLQSEMAKWEEAGNTNNYIEILLSYYDHGYKLGIANPNPDKEKDLFRIADNWRSKALARKTNTHIIKISTYEQ